MSSKLRFALPLLALGAAVWALQSFNQTSSAVTSLNFEPMAALAAPEEEQGFRILLGLNDTESKRWDGLLTITNGALARVEPWRFDLQDAFGAKSETSAQWRLATHPMRAFGGQQQQQQRIVANGVIATFSRINSSSEVTVKTAQGEFSFKPAEINYGKAVKFLSGNALVDRVPASTSVVRTRNEQDFPAATTDRNGVVWVAYQQFTPNPKFIGLRNAQIEPINDFNELKEPTGGDQIFLTSYAQGKWSEPLAVSEPKGDLFKPAVAVDGASRVWVFWAGNNSGNFDLYARPFADGKGGGILKLTTDRGADIFPATTTDTKGNVIVAWQAFRNGRSQIRAAKQIGEKFGEEIIIAASAGNEWNPAIAAASNGEVTIAWDSYRKGDYDIYLRSFDAEGKLGTERAAAATPKYEAYPTIAYDGAQRLWLAWEESDSNWGKDFGADETTGIALYHGRWLRVQVWQGGRVFNPPDVGAALPGVVRRDVDVNSHQSDPANGVQPNPQAAKDRRPSAVPAPPPRPRNSYPHLLVDRGGRVWLAYRTATPQWWNPLGTVWFQNLTSFDGQAWLPAVFITHSDNLLDKQPALASTAAGELLIVNASDGRQQFTPQPQMAAAAQRREDLYNNDLYASRIVLGDSVKPMQLEAAAASTPASPVAAAVASNAPVTADTRRLREYRAKLGNTEYRIMRGEFHRHSEISMDGGNDGSLLDAWRYALDAASLDWIGCCDHDNGAGREYTWWLTQKLSDVFHSPGVFTPMFNYERSVAYPEGHRNVIFAERGIRTLPRLPKLDENDPGNAPDTQLLYRYLKHFNGIVASHTSGTNMGTDWRDNDSLAEPVVEIYQGDRQNYEMPDAPRSNNAGDSIGGWREKGFVSLALLKGYKLAFQASSDHISTHMSYCNLYVTAPTRQAILEAFQKRRVYGATDDILADVRSGEHLMGEAFETAQRPVLNVKLIGTAPFAKVHIIKDNKYVYTVEPKTQTVSFTWRDAQPEAGKQSYYYVRGEQQNSEIVWASPMWITYRGR